MTEGVLDAQLGKEVLKDMLAVFTKEEFVLVAKNTSMEIRGFSERKLASAPAKFLERQVRQGLERMKSAHIFLEAFVSDCKDRFQSGSLNELLIHLKMDDQLTEAAKLCVLAVQYPDCYRDYHHKIRENIDRGLNPLTGLGESNLPLAEKMEVVSQMELAVYLEDLQSVLERHPYRQEIEEYFTRSAPPLRDLFSEKLPKPLEGYYLKALREHGQEVAGWNGVEGRLVMFLALQDALHLAVSSVEELQVRTAEFKKARDLLRQEADSAAESLKQKRGQQKETAKRLVDAEKKVRNMKQEVLAVKVAKQEKEEELKQVIRLLQEEQHRCPGLLGDEPITFLTRRVDDEFLMYFAKEQVLEYRMVEDLQLIESTRKVFINSEDIPTKEMFLLERQLESLGITYRFVSGGAKEIARQIVYYLEGELRYETGQ
ncbi:MAG: hypothetical protein ACI4XL_01235 [Bacillus sp. (in: firmicutes)]